MGRTRKVFTVFAGIGLLLLAGLLAYVLPQHRMVYVDGTEVRRGDGTRVTTAGAPPTLVPGNDVYYLHTSNPERTDIYVFRNEDTGFGLPPYFKMDAAELQGRAQLLARKENQLALVTYYGWRIPVLKLFPNAVDIEAWDRTEEPWPVFNITFLALLTILIGGLYLKLRRWRRARAVRRTQAGD
ncbi:MAG: hypothetical protein K0Q68_2539 [Moraxellaceae bacterium]|jgi:hypothetical protein|nr:hypothetical protein [Moraxellaceae bacterium]